MILRKKSIFYSITWNLIFVIITLFLFSTLLLQVAKAATPEAGGNTTVVNPSGEGAVSINEDAPEPETDNIRLIVPNLVDPGGGTPSAIRIISVTGGTLQQSGGGSITLGTSGTTLSLSSSRVNLRFKPASNRDTNASFQYVVVDPHNSSNNSSESTATIPIIAVNDTPLLQTLVGATGTGLTATYYLTEWDLTGSTYTRLDSTVNFSNNFGVPGLDTEQFSVRWTGKVKSPITGNVTFSTQSDDGVRLWVNGQQIIENWTLHGTTTDTASPVSLVAGELYDIRMEFYERGGGEVAILQWAYSGQGTQVIPQAYLFPATIRPALKFINGSAAVVIDDAITIEDIDDTSIESATVEISTNYQSSEDSLEFTDQSGIEGDYSSGTLTLTGTASLTQYRNALRSVKYYNSDLTPTTSTRTIRFKVNDGSADSNYVYRNIEFTAENSPPVITQGSSTSVTMDEDSNPTAFSLNLDATDADEHSISWSITDQGDHGTASVEEAGNTVAVSYIPTADYYGSDSFIVQASDGLGGLDTITVNVTITDRTPPNISDISATSTSSTSQTITWTTNENASTKVAYGLTSSYGSLTTETDTSPRVTSHSKEITGLLSCTTYHYKVISSDTTPNTTNSADGTFTTSGCAGDTIPTEEENEVITVDDGGEAEVTDGDSKITVTIPEDVTTESGSLVIQIKALPKTDVLNLLGKPGSKPNEVGTVVFDVKAIIDGTTILESFDAPITIKYEYTDSQISGLDEDSLWIYHHSGGEWKAVNDCIVNKTEKTVTCTTPSFSVFGLFGKEIEPEEEEDHDKSCEEDHPSAPKLIQISTYPTAARLYFSTVKPTTGYEIRYGTNPDDLNKKTDFNNTDKNMNISYTVDNLSRATKYYFKIRGINDCEKGDWSKVLSEETTGKTTKSILSTPINFIPEGEIKIVEKTQTSTPALEPEPEPSDQIDQQSNKEPEEGYTLSITVMNEGKPVEGATVEVHSTPRRATTDKDGIARFYDVENGDHTVYLAYQGFKGEEKISLQGDDKNVDINLTIELKPSNTYLSPLAIGILAIAGIVFIILIILLRKKRKKDTS